MSTKKKTDKAKAETKAKSKRTVVGKKDPQSKDAKVGRTSSRFLPCILSNDDLLARAQELASAMQRVENLKDELAASTSRMKEAIKGAEKEVDQIHRVVYTKREERPVECVEVLDYQRRTVRLKRTDTDEVIEARAMTEKELQVPLAFPRAVDVEKKLTGKDGGKDAKGATTASATPPAITEEKVEPAKAAGAETKAGE